MRVEVLSVERLVFDDGTPVRAASALVEHDGGWLVAQDDATHGALVRDGEVRPVRLLPPVEGHDRFSEAEGTKHLKPDLEAACRTAAGALLLGSGSTPARTRAVLVEPAGAVHVADLAPVHAAVRAELGLAPGELNLEGACVVEGRLRWFQRGLPATGVPAAWVDLDLDALVAAVLGGGAVPVGLLGTGVLDLGADLAVTDAVVLPDGGVLVSAAAEDSADTYADGPVGSAALAVLDGTDVRALAPLPPVEGAVVKVEGVALESWASSGEGGRLVATVDADDADVPSLLLRLEVSGVPRQRA